MIFMINIEVFHYMGTSATVSSFESGDVFKETGTGLITLKM